MKKIPKTGVIINNNLNHITLSTKGGSACPPMAWPPAENVLENIRGEERFKKLMERVKNEWENFEV